MHDWNDFYVAVAGAAAALTGLIFVGISINLTRILAVPRLPERALLSLVLLLSCLMISLLFLVPGQMAARCGAALTGLGTIAWAVILRLDLKILAGKKGPFRRQYIFNFSINQVACALFVAAGALLVSGCAPAVYLIVPAVFLSIIKAVADAWVLLIEINR